MPASNSNTTSMNQVTLVLGVGIPRAMVPQRKRGWNTNLTTNFGLRRKGAQPQRGAAAAEMERAESGPRDYGIAADLETTDYAAGQSRSQRAQPQINDDGRRWKFLSAFMVVHLR